MGDFADVQVAVRVQADAVRRGEAAGRARIVATPARSRLPSRSRTLICAERASANG